jgi:hypothetical protein
MGIQIVYKFEGSYTVLLYVTLYTVMCTHTEFFTVIHNTHLLCHVTVWCLNSTKRNFSGEDDRHIMFLMSTIAIYFYDVMKTFSPKEF